MKYFFIIFFLLKIGFYFFGLQMFNSNTHLIVNYIVNGILCSTIVFKIFSTYIQYSRIEKNAHEDGFDRVFVFLNFFFKKIKLARIVVFEISAIYYFCFVWNVKFTNMNSYSSYKQSGNLLIYGVLMFLFLVEGTFLHIFFKAHYPTVNIVFVCLHIYMMISILGQIKAIIFRRTLANENALILRYGLFETIFLEKNSIISISKNSKDSFLEPKLALFNKLEDHNIEIKLIENQTINFPFGKTKSGNSIFLFIDNPDIFIKENTKICI